MSDTNTKGSRGPKKGKDTYILDDSINTVSTKDDGCYWCIHWNQNKDDYDLRAPTMLCDAFDEIPREIWIGRVSHTKPYPGDRGIRFESRLKKE